MFRKNNKNGSIKSAAHKKEAIPSIVTQDFNILGNIVSDGNIDFDGIINGNIRCETLVIRANGQVKGEVVAENVQVYGTVKGLIRAKNIQLFADCNVEGIIMHETLSIEDGANVDGKFKRTDKIKPEEEDTSDSDFIFDDGSSSSSEGSHPMMENIRLIRS